jgi:hypothetical protein
MGDESGYPYLTNKMAYSKYSMYFDGVDDYASLATPTDCGLAASNTFSISFWYKDTDSALANYDMLFANTDGGWETGMGIYYFADTINFFVNSYSNNRATATFAAATRQSWCHICAVYDGTLGSDNIKIYVNGTVGGTTDTLTANLTAISNAFHIGRSGTAALYPTPGNFDEVSVFNTALPATGTGSVDEIYNNGVPNDISGLNPVAYYKMGEGAIFPQIPNEMAYSKQSLLFDGIDDYVEAAIDGTSTGDFGSGAAKEFTISFWIKLPVTNTTDALFHWANTPTSASVMVMIHTQASRIRYYVMGTTGYSPSIALSTDTWYHVVLTRTASDNTNRIYINGVEDTANASTGTSTTNESYADNVYLMEGFYGNMAGNMDDFALFTTALSQSDITSIYNSGTPNDISSLSPYTYWKMGDGDYFPTLTDSGSGGNDGTAYNETGAEMVKLDTPNGWGTAYNETAPEMIQGDTPSGNGGTMMVNMSQADIVQDAPT